MQIILLTLQALKYTSTVFPYTYTVNIQPISPETSNISNIKTPPKIVIRWKKMHISFILDPRRASDHTLTISTYTRSKTYLKYPLVSNITRENRINDRIESNIFIEYLHVLTNNPTARDDCPPNLLNSHHRYEAWAWIDTRDPRNLVSATNFLFFPSLLSNPRRISSQLLRRSFNSGTAVHYMNRIYPRLYVQWVMAGVHHRGGACIWRRVYVFTCVCASFLATKNNFLRVGTRNRKRGKREREREIGLRTKL